MSGGAQKSYFGCADHLDENQPNWCYVRGGVRCAAAVKASSNDGAAWRSCEALSRDVCEEYDDSSMVIAELAEGASLLSPQDLADKLMRLSRSHSRCTECAFATIASTCGDLCLRYQLHVNLIEKLPLTACLPELAARLRKDHAARFMKAVETLDPFSLSAWSLRLDISDLFIPLRGYKQPVYQGLRTSRYMVKPPSSDGGEIWAISTLIDGDGNVGGNEAIAWLDINLATIRLADPSASEPVPMLLDTRLGRCGATFRTAKKPSMTDSVLNFISPEGSEPSSPLNIACWLAMVLGPHATAHAAEPPTNVRLTVELPPDMGELEMVSDLVVASGMIVVLRGHDNVLRVGEYQLRVHDGAQLIVERIRIADSVRSSAFVVLESGFLRLTNSTIHSCSTHLRARDSSGYMAAGGAVFSKGTVQIGSSSLTNNTASAATGGNVFGGAIYSGGPGSRLTLHDTQLDENNADWRDGAEMSRGGAIFAASSIVEINSTLVHASTAYHSGGGLALKDCKHVRIEDTELSDNSASTAGGVWAINSDVSFRGLKLLNNVADRRHGKDEGFGTADASGGGMTIGQLSNVRIVQSELAGNRAVNSASFTQGGAVYMYDRSSVDILDTAVTRNAVIEGATSAGGAIFLTGNSSLHILRCNVEHNMARAKEGCAGAGFAQGGAISVDSPARVYIVDSSFRFNNVSGRSESRSAARGGAIFVQEGAISMDVHSTRMLGNGIYSPFAECSGGTIFGSKGAVVTLASGSSILKSRVQCASSSGGGVWTSAVFVIAGAEVSQNEARADGDNGVALGGAFYMEAPGLTTITNSIFEENVARISRIDADKEFGAKSANGGILYIRPDARARLSGCFLRQNAAGGAGKYFYSSKVEAAKYADKGFEELAGSAMLIYSEGAATLINCTAVQADDGMTVSTVEHPVWWWIVIRGGSLVLKHSVFSDHTEHVFDPCPYVGNDKCDVPSSCSRGDWVDCRKAPPQTEQNALGRFLIPERPRY